MREQCNNRDRPFRSGSLILLLVAAILLAAPTAASAGIAVGVSVTLAPPAIPVYVQPPIPGPGYIWTPGYWAWDVDFGYYWVPGTWVLAPSPGLLWTPGYWAWDDGVYVWYAGYWGPVVGFYGGIDYGFGYAGFGYEGGYWDHGTFYYNRAVNNVSVTNIRNVYYKNVVVNNVTANRVSYNGGPGGTAVRPTAAESRAARERHVAPTSAQMRHERIARTDPAQRAAVNHGRPTVAATARPGVFTGRGVVQASRAGAPYKPAMSGSNARAGTGARTPNREGVGRRPSAVTPRIAGPQRPVVRHEQPMGGIRRQESGRAPAVTPGVAGPQRPAERHEQPMGNHRERG